MNTNLTPITLAAIMAKIMKRRPLWAVRTVEDFFNLSRAQVIAKIDEGEFPFAFDIGQSTKQAELRILSWSVMEVHCGPFKEIGATKNLGLPAVIDLILPQRDIRSTELKRAFSCSSEHVYCLAKVNFKVTCKPAVKDGPNAYTVYSRASVASFLEKRRVI